MMAVMCAHIVAFSSWSGSKDNKEKGERDRMQWTFVVVALDYFILKKCYYNKSKWELVDVGTLFVVVELKQKKNRFK